MWRNRQIFPAIWRSINLRSLIHNDMRQVSYFFPSSSGMLPVSPAWFSPPPHPPRPAVTTNGWGVQWINSGPPTSPSDPKRSKSSSASPSSLTGCQGRGEWSNNLSMHRDLGHTLGASPPDSLASRALSLFFTVSRAARLGKEGGWALNATRL